MGFKDLVFSGKKTVDYDFEALDHINFRCVVTVPRVSNRMFVSIFNKNKKKFNAPDASLDGVEGFDIDERYLKLVTTSLNSVLSDIKREVGLDGVKVLRWVTTKSSYVKNGDVWSVITVLHGEYMKT